MDSLWVQDQPQRKSNTPRLHKDDDLPPHLRSPSLDSTKRPLSRFGQFIVLCLLLLGLRELIGVGSSRDGQKRKGSIKVERRNPFAVLKDLKPPSSRYSTSIPALDSTWKVDTRTSLNTGSHEGNLVRGDVTAVILHWKRTENVRVILASLCQYEFIESIIVWNNNPDIILTHKVRLSLSSSTFTFSSNLLTSPSVFNDSHSLRPSVPPRSSEFTILLEIYSSSLATSLVCKLRLRTVSFKTTIGWFNR